MSAGYSLLASGERVIYIAFEPRSITQEVPTVHTFPLDISKIFRRYTLM